MPNETIGTMLYDCLPAFALDPRIGREETIRSAAPPDHGNRGNDGCRPDRPYERGHGRPSEASGIQSRGCEKDQQDDPIASRDPSIPLWNIRRGCCQPFFEQLGIMTKQ